MTTDLEKQFFDTFGIEPKNRFKGCKLGIDHYTSTCIQETCKGCKYEIREKQYPEITDTHYLQLICELSGVCCPHFAFERDISELKEVILKFCIHYKDQLEKSVQALFKEER